MAGTAGIQEILVVYFNQSAGTAANQDYTLTRAGTISSISTTLKTTDGNASTLTVTRVRAGPALAVVTTPAVTVGIVVGVTGAATNLQFNTLVSGDILRFANSNAIVTLDAFVSIVPPVAGLVNIA